MKKKCVFVFVTRLVHIFKKWQLIGLPRFLNGLRVDRVNLWEEKLCFAPLQDSRLDQKFFHFPTFKNEPEFPPYAITSGKSFEWMNLKLNLQISYLNILIFVTDEKNLNHLNFKRLIRVSNYGELISRFLLFWPSFLKPGQSATSP